MGGRLVEALLERGVEVRALARSDASAAILEGRGARVVRGDLSDVAALRSGMNGVDVVYHLAAKVKLWGDPAEFDAVNVEGTAHVIEAARDGGVPRLGHVSPEAVLAGTPIVDAKESSAYPAKPVGEYPRSKAEAEKLVLAAKGLDTIVLRPRLVWGRGDSTVLPALVDAVRGGSFRWIEEGKYLSSTCHVSNVVEALLLAAEHGRPRGVYFLSDGKPQVFRDFVTRLLATAGVKPPTATISRGRALYLAGWAERVWRFFRRAGEPPITRTAVYLMGGEVTVNDTRARDELGYVGRTTVSAGLAEMKP